MEPLRIMDQGQMQDTSALVQDVIAPLRPFALGLNHSPTHFPHSKFLTISRAYAFPSHVYSAW